jgi:hypothetical protein
VKTKSQAPSSHARSRYAPALRAGKLQGSSKSQAPTLSDRAKKAIWDPVSETQPADTLSNNVFLLRQNSTQAFLLAEFATEKGEVKLGSYLRCFARSMGTSAGLIEDLAKEQLRRSKKTIRANSRSFAGRKKK